MQSPPPRSAKPRRSRDPVRDGLVVVSMTVVALALGIGLHLQFALAFWLAVVAALSVYVALLSTHVLVRRAEYVDELRREVARLEAGSAKPATGNFGQAPAGSPGAYQPPQLATPGRPSPTGAQAPGAAMKDYWNVPPAGFAGQPDPKGPLPASSPAPAAGNAPTQPSSVASQQRDADAEQINAVIKKLAADINQGQAAFDRAGVVSAGAVAEDVDESVAALQAAADAMRQAELPPDPTATESLFEERRLSRRSNLPPPLPAEPGAGAARERLAAVAAALEAERFDVMLEPIMGLPDRRAQHYVVSVRMWDGLDGSVAGPSGVRSAPGSGLLPLLDAVKVERAARVVWRMEDRGKSGALFSQLSGESLVSDRFLNRFADTYRQGEALSGRLVLSFRQAELRLFSELQWSTLRDMADLGFRFCLEDITTLDQNFAELVAAGFTFARLDAGVFLEGLPTEQGMIPAADICRHFAALRLMVIVGGIADDTVSGLLQGYGVELGQGGLFGAPRPVKADVLRNPHAAVA